MDLVLDIATSAEFWRKIYPVNRAPKSSSAVVPSECASTIDQVLSLSPTWITPQFLEPLGGCFHVMVFDAESRRRSASHIAHVWSGPIPEGSFYDLGNNVFIAAPEFMFLVAATLLDVPEIIAFGCELCGLYGFDESRKRGFRKRKVPLTTIAKMTVYLAGAQDCRGHAKATAALQYIVENSASPMETFDVMTMCLPYRLGGYGLDEPQMNYAVPLNCRAARIGKRQTCYADMCYSDIGLDIEHHGKLDHSEPEDQASDRARVNALKEMGFEVIELTKDQVEDLLAFEYIIQRIARLIGKRLDKRKLGPTPERLALRRKVFAWNRSSGRLR